MANFGGIYFLPFFPKTTLSASKWQFLEKISTFVGFRGKIAVLRHLEDFLGKMEESRPPLKLKYNGGLLSAIFSKNHSKCLKLTLENSQKSGFYSSEHVSLTIVKGAMRFRESPMVIIYPK